MLEKTYIEKRSKGKKGTYTFQKNRQTNRNYMAVAL